MSDTETCYISSVLSDTNLDEMMETFDELIQSSERFVESIKESSGILESIHKGINSNNSITVTYNNWSGDFDELLDTIYKNTIDNGEYNFGQVLLDVLETGIIH
jgi:hypothetical protein